jgi:hypothetical protein
MNDAERSIPARRTTPPRPNETVGTQPFASRRSFASPSAPLFRPTRLMGPGPEAQGNLNAHCFPGPLSRDLISEKCISRSTFCLRGRRLQRLFPITRLGDSRGAGSAEGMRRSPRMFGGGTRSVGANLSEANELFEGAGGDSMEVPNEIVAWQVTSVGVQWTTRFSPHSLRRGAWPPAISPAHTASRTSRPCISAVKDSIRWLIAWMSRVSSVFCWRSSRSWRSAS